MGMPAKTRALRKVLREAPCSMRALARAAGVAHQNLVLARDGLRPVSDAMAASVAAALRTWADTCDRLADEMERATEEGER